MTEPAVRHPIFARAWDRLCGLMERELAVQRQELLAGLTGRVLEIGAGNGNNFEHYPATVDEVIALEPEPYLRGKAHEAATRAPVRVTVREGVAEALPVGDESFDAAIASRVLCTVRDQERALAELRRVVRPGAELRFLEHVRSPHARTAWLQERLDGSGIWPWLGGGCHCARDTLGAVTAAGFGVQRVRASAHRRRRAPSKPGLEAHGAGRDHRISIPRSSRSSGQTRDVASLLHGAKRAGEEDQRVFDRRGVQVVDLGHVDPVIAGGMLGDDLTLE